MPFSLSNDRYVAPAGVVSRDVAGTTVLLNIDRGEYFTLDEIGSRVWRVLTSGVSIVEAHHQLLGEYEIEPAQLEDELRALADQLEQRGLIEIRPVPS